MDERIFTFLVNINSGSHQTFTKVDLTEEETKGLYRFTYNLDESTTVDIDCISPEQFYVMEEKLGVQLLTLLADSNTLLDPLYGWLGELV